MVHSWCDALVVGCWLFFSDWWKNNVLPSGILCNKYLAKPDAMLVWCNSGNTGWMCMCYDFYATCWFVFFISFCWCLLFATSVEGMVDLSTTIGIDHDTVCAGVGGTAIRHSTSCAGRRAAACGARAGRHNECCAWWQYHPRQRRPYKWSISILPRSQFYKKQGKLAFSTSCTAVRPHWRLRNDAWRRDS